MSTVSNNNKVISQLLLFLRNYFVTDSNIKNFLIDIHNRIIKCKCILIAECFYTQNEGWH